MGDQGFTRLSPLRQIPAWVDDGLVRNDLSVICQYLEHKQPTPALYPRDLADRAHARWLEALGDSWLADGLHLRLFYQLGAKRHLFHEETDQAVVRQAREAAVPAALDHLENRLPDAGFTSGAFSIADISIASLFRTAAFMRFVIDAQRWPRCAILMALVQALPVFQKLDRFEDAVMRLPLANQRSALNTLGAPLCRDTYGTGTPQYGFRRGS